MCCATLTLRDLQNGSASLRITDLPNVMHFGRIDLLIWLTENYSREEIGVALCDPINIYKIVRNGQMHVLSWLTENFAELVAAWLNDAHVCGRMITRAAMRGNIYILNWLHAEIGVLTEEIKENIRFNYCQIIPEANVLALDWLHQREVFKLEYLRNYAIGGALRTWMRTENYLAALWLEKKGANAMDYANAFSLPEDMELLKPEAENWLFDRTAESDYGYGETGLWWRNMLHRRQLCVLTLLLSGRRQRLPRLPPEIWEQCVQPLMCGGN
jgi:hypothetical protein